MDLPICFETHRFIEPTTVDIVGADNIRPSKSDWIRRSK